MNATLLAILNTQCKWWQCILLYGNRGQFGDLIDFVRMTCKKLAIPLDPNGLHKEAYRYMDSTTKTDIT